MRQDNIGLRGRRVVILLSIELIGEYVLGCWVRSGGGRVWRGLPTWDRPALFSPVGQRTRVRPLSRWGGWSVRYHVPGTPLLPTGHHARRLSTALRLRLHRQQSLGTPPLPRRRIHNTRCCRRRRR